MNVLLFGPPGIGKSTIVARCAAIIGPDRAIDLEELPVRKLYQLMGWNWMFCEGRIANRNVIGGADLDPKDFYPGTIKVLLVLPEDEYRDRRRYRDMQQPDKAKQAPQTVQSWKQIPGLVHVTANDQAVYKIINFLDGDLNATR